MLNFKKMGVIATDKNENILFYNSNNSIDKQAFAYTEDSKNKMLAIDVSKTKVSDTQWLEICEKLDITLEDLIKKDHPDFRSLYNKTSDLSEEDWLKVIQNHPNVVAFPILVVGNQFYRIETPSDVRHYLNVSTEGIDEKKHL